MTNLQLIFFLGPLYFFPGLMTIGSTQSIDTVVFLTSAMGTVFWAAVIGAFAGLLQRV